MAEKVVKIAGKEWHFKANALIPRMYRFKFKRDLMSDMLALEKRIESIEKTKMKADEKEIAQLNATDLTIFENVAWCFIKAAGKENVGESPDEWLENLDSMFSIYEVLPEIMDLWAETNEMTSVPAKK